MDLNEARREILNRVAGGELSAETADRLLAALEDDIFQPEALSESSEPEMVGEVEWMDEHLPPPFESILADLPVADEPGMDDLAGMKDMPCMRDAAPRADTPVEQDDEMRQRVARWQRSWVVLFLVGLAVTALGAYWMYRGWLAAGPGWGFWLAWIPFLAGTGLAVFACASTEMPWLHLSVSEDRPGRDTHIHLTFPLPLKWAAWVMTHFERYMPDDLRDKDVAEFIALFEESIGKDQPFRVLVDEEDEHVDIAIFKL